MNRIKRRNLNHYQTLEARRLLAVSAYTSGENLYVKGDADGLVEIVATDDGTFNVTDNGADMGTFTGVDGTIRISMDSAGAAANDHVKVDLDVYSVENLLVNLGGGDNVFEVESLTQNSAGVNNRLFFKGGSGNDEFHTHMQTKGYFTADMGAGDDTMTAFGRGETIRFAGGEGDDSFTLLEEEHYFQNFAETAIFGGPGNDTLTIAGRVGHAKIWGGADHDVVNFSGVSSDGFFHLGQGDNTLNHSGWVARDMRVRGGSGHDSVNLESNSFTGWNAYILLGDGDNTFNLDSTVSFQSGYQVVLRGGAGSDTVNIAPTTEIRGSLRSVLGEGDNILDNHGDIDGDLVAISRNIDDVFEDYGEVDGRIYLKPGGQR